MNSNNLELISVIIPTYKRNDSLNRAIKSVINQTYKNIEIIVVDDNANFHEFRKKTREIVSQYDNVKLIENEKNLGGGLSRNVGIDNSKGNFVAFLDDDDEFLPEKIEKQYSLLKKLNDEKVAIVYCYANMIRTDRTSYSWLCDYEGSPIKENISCCIAATSWWLCNKKALLDVGGFEDISSRQDATLITKLLLKGYKIYRVPEILLNYYWHSGDGISKINLKSIDAEKKYMKIFNDNKNNMKKDDVNEINYIFYSRLAHIYLLLNMKSEAKYNYVEMRKIYKYRFKNLKILFGILFNKLYIYIANKKDIKRKGK